MPHQLLVSRQPAISTGAWLTAESRFTARQTDETIAATRAASEAHRRLATSFLYMMSDVDLADRPPQRPPDRMAANTIASPDPTS
jgi:hypothetical protein